MDSPTLGRDRHLPALDALERVNRVSLATRRVWKEVARLARGATGPVRVLDVACGGGDVLVAVAKRAAASGIAVECHGCDLSPVALERAERRGGRELGIALTRLDVSRESLPVGYDIVCSNLFLHHLDRAAAARLLRSMADASTEMVLVQDLLRTRLGYLMAWMGLHTLTRSEVARRDGLVSVAAAFTLEEAGRLCDEAGLRGATVRPCWPQRFLLRWERP
jgi:SAM-dependent methyltransferase